MHTSISDVGNSLTSFGADRTAWSERPDARTQSGTFESAPSTRGAAAESVEGRWRLAIDGERIDPWALA
jgi:hypothetical protein